MDHEITRATVAECFVYKVPPRARAEGYKAADWNLNESIWTGKAVVKSRGPVCVVRLEGHDGTLFAQCQVGAEGPVFFVCSKKADAVGPDAGRACC
jgi:hypothetical protein